MTNATPTYTVRDLILTRSDAGDAGFIIADAAAVFGTGPTVEIAWADLRRGMSLAKIPHQSEVDTEDAYCPKYWSEDEFEVLPATAGLLAEVERRGGAIAWSVVDGVACTEAEAQ